MDGNLIKYIMKIRNIILLLLFNGNPCNGQIEFDRDTNKLILQIWV